MFASPNTINGEFPPASIETLRVFVSWNIDGRSSTGVDSHFFSELEAIPYRSLATGVLPVNEIFLTALLSQISLPTGKTFFCVVTMLITPSGNPARLANFLEGQPNVRTFTKIRACLGDCKGREWGLRCGLDDRCATGSQSGAKFSGYHGRREVPWCEDATVYTVVTKFVVDDRIQLTRHLGTPHEPAFRHERSDSPMGCLITIFLMLGTVEGICSVGD